MPKSGNGYRSLMKGSRRTCIVHAIDGSSRHDLISLFAVPVEPASSGAPDRRHSTAPRCSVGSRVHFWIGHGSLVRRCLNALAFTADVVRRRPYSCAASSPPITRWSASPNSWRRQPSALMVLRCSGGFAPAITGFRVAEFCRSSDFPRSFKRRNPGDHDHGPLIRERCRVPAPAPLLPRCPAGLGPRDHRHSRAGFGSRLLLRCLNAGSRVHGGRRLPATLIRRHIALLTLFKRTPDPGHHVSFSRRRPCSRAASSRPIRMVRSPDP